MATAKDILETEIPNRLTGKPELAKEVNSVIHFNITGDGGGTWTVDCKNTPGVRVGEEPADVTLELSAGDWATISANPGAAMQLYFTGKLKVTGNAMLATKLQKLLA